MHAAVRLQTYLAHRNEAGRPSEKAIAMGLHR
jgi:hypothetical protein